MNWILYGFPRPLAWAVVGRPFGPAKRNGQTNSALVSQAFGLGFVGSALRTCKARVRVY